MTKVLARFGTGFRVQKNWQFRERGDQLTKVNAL